MSVPDGKVAPCGSAWHGEREGNPDCGCGWGDLCEWTWQPCSQCGRTGRVTDQFLQATRYSPPEFLGRQGYCAHCACSFDVPQTAAGEGIPKEGPAFDERPVHQPAAPEAPIPGRHWYGGCDPDLPRVNADGICEGCGRRACSICGREFCDDFDHLDGVASCPACRRTHTVGVPCSCGGRT